MLKGIFLVTFISPISGWLDTTQGHVHICSFFWTYIAQITCQINLIQTRRLIPLIILLIYLTWSGESETEFTPSDLDSVQELYIQQYDDEVDGEKWVEDAAGHGIE
jgi:hypothetical protein